MALTAPPTAPDSSDPTTFDARADALVAWHATNVSEMTAFQAALTSIAAGTADAIPYTFSTTTTDSDPGNGTLRLDNATQNTATTIRTDLLGSDASDWTSVLATFANSTSVIKGRITLVKLADATKWLSFDITALASPSGYKNLTVSNVGSSAASPFANNDAIMLKFTRVGDKGANGGAVAVQYTFSTTTTDSDPGNGTLRLGSATQNAATVIRTDLLSSDTTDYTALLDTLDASTSTVKGEIRISKIGDETKWLTFNMTARAAPTGYRNFTVTNTGSSAASPFANGDAIMLSFTRNGDKGDTGLTGSTPAPIYAWGDASDGNVTISGSVTLTKDMYYNNLTIAAGAALQPAGFRIFVAGTLDLSAAPVGAITFNANSASGVTNGATLSATGKSISVGAAGAGGGSGASGGGNGGNASIANPGANGGASVGAGNGGASGGGDTGGNGGAAGAATYVGHQWPGPPMGLSVTGTALSIIGAGAGGNGGGGGASVANNGGNGGAGGAGAGAILIVANIVARGSNATAAIIQLKGGDGGNGTNPGVAASGGGGGGSAGGGGEFILMYGSLTGSTITNAVDLSGGKGGNGGNGTGTGLGGNGGASGGSGVANYYNLTSGTITTTASVAGTGGAGAAGTTGGTGHAANTKQINL